MRGLIVCLVVLLGACDSDGAAGAAEALGGEDVGTTEWSMLVETEPGLSFPATEHDDLHVGRLRAGRAHLLLRFTREQLEDASRRAGSSGVELLVPLRDSGGASGFGLQRMRPWPWRAKGATWSCAAEATPFEPALDCDASRRWIVGECGGDPRCAYVETPKGAVARGVVQPVDAGSFTEAVVFDLTEEIAVALGSAGDEFSWMVVPSDELALATVIGGDLPVPDRPHLRWATPDPDGGSTDAGTGTGGGDGGGIPGDDAGVGIERCDNGADDDGDGDIDCADPDCSTFHACVAEDCTNAADDDGDGSTDCADAECHGSASCEVPDPPSAPPLPPGDHLGVHDAHAFLYEGADAVQHGVASGGIDPERGALIYGHVFDRSGEPVPGVRVSVLNHPEVGWTHTRADGRFDLLAEGGGKLTIDYQRPGYVPIQRAAEVEWGGYGPVDDVVLIPYDANVTTVELPTGGSSGPQLARGSVEVDADGSRQATVFFPSGTTATLESGGSTSPVTTLSVRATEYTVGETGPAAMPGDLPPEVGYTYAVHAERLDHRVRERQPR